MTEFVRDVVGKTRRVVAGAGIDFDAMLFGISHCPVTSLWIHEENLVLQVLLPGEGDHGQGRIVADHFRTRSHRRTLTGNGHRQGNHTKNKQRNQTANHQGSKAKTWTSGAEVGFSLRRT